MIRTSALVFLAALASNSCMPSDPACSVSLEVVVDGVPAVGQATLRSVDEGSASIVEMVAGKCSFTDVAPGSTRVDFRVSVPYHKLIPYIDLELPAGVRTAKRVDVVTTPLRIIARYPSESSEEWNIMIRGAQSWGPALVPGGGELLIGVPAPGVYEIIATRRDQYGKMVVGVDVGGGEIVAEVLVPVRLPVECNIRSRSDGQFIVIFDGPSPIPSAEVTVVGGMGRFKLGEPDHGEYSAYLVSAGGGRRDSCGPIKFAWPQSAISLDFINAAVARMGRADVK